MKILLKTLAVAAGVVLAVTWYAGREDRALKSLAEQYASHAPNFTLGVPYAAAGKMRVIIQPASGAVLCDVGGLRLALLGREQPGILGASFSTSPDVPDSQTDVDSTGQIRFSSHVSDAGTECQVLDLPFFYRDGRVRIAGQWFSIGSPAVLVVDAANEVVFVREGEHAGLAWGFQRVATLPQSVGSVSGGS